MYLDQLWNWKSGVLAAILLMVGSSMEGCASLVHGSNQQISLTSTPSAASVSVDGQSDYKTPTTVKLPRKRDHSLVFTKEGYEDKQVTVMHVVSGAVAGNIIAGGLIGWGVDAMTGAQYKLVPELVHVMMDPATAGAQTTPLTGAQELTPQERLVQLQKLKDDKLITDEEFGAMRLIILDEIAARGQPVPGVATPQSAESVAAPVQTPPPSEVPKVVENPKDSHEKRKPTKSTRRRND